MFAAGDLSAWKQHGNANWQFINQQLVMTQGEGWLVGKLPLQNAIIEVEYMVRPETMASLYVHCTNTNFISSETSYQINLSSFPVDGYGAGSLVGTVSAEQRLNKNQWFTVRVSVIDAYINVWLNGKKVVDNLFDTRFNKGPLAIRASGGEFRIKKFSITIPGRW